MYMYMVFADNSVLLLDAAMFCTNIPEVQLLTLSFIAYIS